MNDDDQGSADLSTFNLVAAAVLTLFGVFSLVYLIPGHVPASAAHDQGLSARFMPNLAASALTLLAVILGANVLWRKIRGRESIKEDNEDNDVQGFGARELRYTAALIGGTSVYVFLLSILGFVIASALALVFSLYLGGNRNWLLMGTLSIGLPLGVAQLLWWLLTIQVPGFALLG